MCLEDGRPKWLRSMKLNPCKQSAINGTKDVAISEIYKIQRRAYSDALSFRQAFSAGDLAYVNEANMGETEE